MNHLWASYFLKYHGSHTKQLCNCQFDDKVSEDLWLLDEVFSPLSFVPILPLFPSYRPKAQILCIGCHSASLEQVCYSIIKIDNCNKGFGQKELIIISTFRMIYFDLLHITHVKTFVAGFWSWNAVHELFPFFSQNVS